MLPRFRSQPDEQIPYIETGFHIQLKQKLTAQEEQARLEMCNWFNDKMVEDYH